jgi:hypothetical protein
MDAAREDDAIAECNGGLTLGLKMQIGIEQGIFAEPDRARTVDAGAPEHNHGSGKRSLQLASESGMCPQPARGFAQLRRGSQ